MTFISGETEQTFTFTATQDTDDDEGESVLLRFGSDLSGGVSAGTLDETTVTITDDDPPEVSFGQSAYTVVEGGTVSVQVKLTSAPASAVTVPVTHTPQGATSSTAYSGVPANVMFSAIETSKSFTFTATQDTVDDDGKSVLLTSGRCPPRCRQNDDPVDRHHPPTTTSPAGCESGDICVAPWWSMPIGSHPTTPAESRFIGTTWTTTTRTCLSLPTRASGTRFTLAALARLYAF